MTTPENPVKPSCINCPSFIKAGDTQAVFRREMNIPMCGRYGYPLGIPSVKGQALTDLWEHKANACPGFGRERPIALEQMATHLTMAAPEVVMLGSSDPSEQMAVGTCQQCRFFVDEMKVQDRWGVRPAGLCAGTGRLLLSGRYAKEARACNIRRPGFPDIDLNHLLPLPEFHKLANIFMQGGEDYTGTDSDVIEPRDYETDKAVGPAAQKAGIRAWRKIVNPRNDSKFVFLPIYADEAFTEDEQKLIPRTGDDEHPELYRDHGGVIFRVAMAWVGLDETPALWGEAGTGKTELFRHMAWLMNLPFRRISITASSEVDDLVGKAQFSPERGTYFVYGRIPQAWMRPGVICLDEPNVGPPEVWQFIRPMTDNSKQLVIDQNASEHIPRNDDCYLGLAMNPAWDPRNIGAQQLADADGSRLGHIRMSLPPPIVEKQIIKKRCELDGFAVSDSQLVMVERIAKDVRQLAEDGTLPISWGVRNQIKVARALQFLDPVEAYRFAVIDSLEPEVGEEILRVVTAIAPN